MKQIEFLILSFRNLSLNKMRSFLTMLGIIVGVMSIVLLISIVAGTQAKIEGEIKSVGSNVFMVIPGNFEETHGPPGNFSINKLKMKHVEIIESQSTYGAKACPVFFIIGETVKYRHESRNSSFIGGTTEKFPFVRNWNVKYGDFFRMEDVDMARKVGVVGNTIVTDLFNGSNPVGKDIMVNAKKIKIIGVLNEKGRMFGNDIDDIVIIPITTAHEIFGSTTINQILVKVNDQKYVEDAVVETKKILKKDMDKEDFSLRSQSEMLNMFNTFANILGIVLSCIASISLLVGGIGIMNIMLVTVKERTREIGLRKAIGANYTDILIQFISESFAISVTGSVIGIGLSVLIIAIIAPFVPFPLKASISAILIAFGFSSLTGIFFGTYPAVKAAKLNPIIALRYE